MSETRMPNVELVLHSSILTVEAMAGSLSLVPTRFVQKGTTKRPGATPARFNVFVFSDCTADDQPDAEDLVKSMLPRLHNLPSIYSQLDYATISVRADRMHSGSGFYLSCETLRNLGALGLGLEVLL